MSTNQPIPVTRLATSWGELVARCSHPHCVGFAAGDDDSPLLSVEDYTYTCHVAAYKDRAGDPNPRQRIYLRDGWYMLASEVRRALSPRSGVAALDRHEQEFINIVLPELAEWIVTTPAADLVAEGTVYWRRECADWAVSTETDFNRSLDRLRAIRDAIAAGEVPTDADERYLRYARVEPR
jgi:hypothetical protein